MKSRLPIIRRRIMTDKMGRTCIVDVTIEQSNDYKKYQPDGKDVSFGFSEKGEQVKRSMI